MDDIVQKSKSTGGMINLKAQWNSDELRHRLTEVCREIGLKDNDITGDLNIVDE
jgi:hypothetical protein